MFASSAAATPLTVAASFGLIPLSAAWIISGAPSTLKTSEAVSGSTSTFWKRTSDCVRMFLKAGSETIVIAADWISGRAIAAFGAFSTIAVVNCVATAVCTPGSLMTAETRLAKASEL